MGGVKNHPQIIELYEKMQVHSLALLPRDLLIPELRRQREILLLTEDNLNKLYMRNGEYKKMSEALSELSQVSDPEADTPSPQAQELHNKLSALRSEMQQKDPELRLYVQSVQRLLKFHEECTELAFLTSDERTAQRDALNTEIAAMKSALKSILDLRPFPALMDPMASSVQAAVTESVCSTFSTPGELSQCEDVMRSFVGELTFCELAHAHSYWMLDLAQLSDKDLQLLENHYAKLVSTYKVDVPSDFKAAHDTFLHSIADLNKAYAVREKWNSLKSTLGTSPEMITKNLLEPFLTQIREHTKLSETLDVDVLSVRIDDAAAKATDAAMNAFRYYHDAGAKSFKVSAFLFLAHDPTTVVKHYNAILHDSIKFVRAAQSLPNTLCLDWAYTSHQDSSAQLREQKGRWGITHRETYLNPNHPIMITYMKLRNLHKAEMKWQAIQSVFYEGDKGVITNISVIPRLQHYIKGEVMNMMGILHNLNSDNLRLNANIILNNLEQCLDSFDEPNEKVRACSPYFNLYMEEMMSLYSELKRAPLQYRNFKSLHQTLNIAFSILQDFITNSNTDIVQYIGNILDAYQKLREALELPHLEIVIPPQLKAVDSTEEIHVMTVAETVIRLQRKYRILGHSAYDSVEQLAKQQRHVQQAQDNLNKLYMRNGEYKKMSEALSELSQVSDPEADTPSPQAQELHNKLSALRSEMQQKDPELRLYVQSVQRLLKFHEECTELVFLTSDERTAQRDALNTEIAAMKSALKSILDLRPFPALMDPLVSSYLHGFISSICSDSALGPIENCMDTLASTVMRATGLELEFYHARWIIDLAQLSDKDLQLLENHYAKLVSTYKVDVPSDFKAAHDTFLHSIADLNKAYAVREEWKSLQNALKISKSFNPEMLSTELRNFLQEAELRIESRDDMKAVDDYLDNACAKYTSSCWNFFSAHRSLLSAFYAEITSKGSFAFKSFNIVSSLPPSFYSIALMDVQVVRRIHLSRNPHLLDELVGIHNAAARALTEIKIGLGLYYHYPLINSVNKYLGRTFFTLNEYLRAERIANVWIDVVSLNGDNTDIMHLTDYLENRWKMLCKQESQLISGEYSEFLSYASSLITCLENGKEKCIETRTRTCANEAQITISLYVSLLETVEKSPFHVRLQYDKLHLIREELQEVHTLLMLDVKKTWGKTNESGQYLMHACQEAMERYSSLAFQLTREHTKRESLERCSIMWGKLLEGTKPLSDPQKEKDETPHTASPKLGKSDAGHVPGVPEQGKPSAASQRSSEEQSNQQAASSTETMNLLDFESPKLGKSDAGRVPGVPEQGKPSAASQPSHGIDGRKHPIRPSSNQSAKRRRTIALIISVCGILLFIIFTIFLFQWRCNRSQTQSFQFPASVYTDESVEMNTFYFKN